MLNEDKIRLMTKLALHEQGEGKKAIEFNRYSKKDYISFQMIKTAVVITLAYILVVALCILQNAEHFVDQLISVKLVSLGIQALVCYVIVFVVYMLISYMIYSMRYIHMQELNRGYAEDLKQLYLMYKKEEKNKREGNLEAKFEQEFEMENEEKIEEEIGGEIGEEAGKETVLINKNVTLDEMEDEDGIEYIDSDREETDFELQLEEIDPEEERGKTGTGRKRFR